jgi:hypothetical protein
MKRAAGFRAHDSCDTCMITDSLTQQAHNSRALQNLNYSFNDMPILISSSTPPLLISNGSDHEQKPFSGNTTYIKLYRSGHSMQILS